MICPYCGGVMDGVLCPVCGFVEGLSRRRRENGKAKACKRSFENEAKRRRALQGKRSFAS